jgi:hypothetical protein
VLAKTTNITGFNDIAATAVVSAGAITTSSGAVSNVTNVGTLTTYTGNTPQTGDSFARIGATGSGLTSLAPSATALSTVQWTNTRAGNLDFLDVAVSSRLATVGYTAPDNAGIDAIEAAVATLADDVWDVVLASHVTAGSTGAALNGAGAAGDPWSIVIPGAYAVGTAGHRLGNIPTLTQTLSAARDLSAIADTSLTLNDALHCAIAGAVGQRDATAVSTMTVKTPFTATLLRTYTITLATPPTVVPTKIV